MIAKCSQNRVFSTVLIRCFGVNCNLSQNMWFMCYSFCLNFGLCYFFSSLPDFVYHIWNPTNINDQKRISISLPLNTCVFASIQCGGKQIFCCFTNDRCFSASSLENYQFLSVSHFGVLASVIFLVAAYHLHHLGKFEIHKYLLKNDWRNSRLSFFYFMISVPQTHLVFFDWLRA